MATISIPEIQTIAVRCTSDFLNHGTPLNQGLAKVAGEMGLNSDQLKRAVEATNTLTYLKSIEVTGNRAAEFPVADYGEIIKLASVPELRASEAANLGVEKQASVSPAEGFLEKAAAANEALAFSMPEMTKQEMFAHFTKQAAANSRALDDLIVQSRVLVADLLKTAEELKQNPSALEHLSAEVKDDNLLKMATIMVFGKPEKRLEFASTLVKSASFNNVSAKSVAKKAVEMGVMLKQASEMQGEITRRQDLKVRCEEMTKQAFVGALLGAGLGRAAAGTAKLAVKPFTAAAKGIAAFPRAMARVGASKVQNLVANTSRGKALGIPTIQPSMKSKVLTGTGIVGATAAMDASMYTPKVDPAKDQQGSVWSALQ